MNSMNTVQVNSIYSVYVEYPLTTAKQTMDGSPCDVSEEPVTQEKRKKDWRRSCDVGEATEGLQNEQSSFSNLSVTSPMSQLILQPFRRFTLLILKPFRHFAYVTAHSPTPPSLHLAHSPTLPSLHLAHSPTFPSLRRRHSSFSNPSVASPTSQLILQPVCCFTYVTAHSQIVLSLLLCHRIFTSVTWRAAHETNCSLTSLNQISPLPQANGYEL